MKKTYLDQKQKLAVLESADKIGVRAAAKVAGVHYTTVYEWKRQLEAIGEENFVNYRPDYSGRGEKEIAPEQEKAILDEWQRNPGYGPGQIRNQLRRQAITISIRTIRKIMAANGYQAPGKKRDKGEIKRFEAGRPLGSIIGTSMFLYFLWDQFKAMFVLDGFASF